MAITAAARTDIIRLFVGALNAAPGANNLNTLVAAYEGGASLANLAATIAATDDFKSIYPPLQTGQEFVNALADRLLGNEVAAAQRTEAVNMALGMLNGGMSRAEVVLTAVQMLTAVTSAAPLWVNAGAAFANKVEVATYYSVTKLQSSSDLGVLQNVLSGVTSAAASVTTAKTSIDNTEVVNPGQTFALTSAIDNLKGTSGNDKFIGDNTGTTNTVSAGDSIDGVAGNNTLEYYGAAAAVVLPQMSKIQTLNLHNPALTTDLNTRSYSDLTDVNIVGKAIGANDLTGISVSGAQTLGLVSVSQDTANKIDIAYQGTNAKLHVANSSSVGIVNMNGTTVTTLNVHSSGTGTGNTIKALASTGPEATVNLTGSQKLTITDALADTVKTVNASGTSGGVVVTAGDADVTFTGGSGNDMITFAATQFNAKDVVNGGAGRDTVVLNDIAVTGDQLKAVNAFTSVEVLGFGTTGATLDVSTVTSLSEYDVRNAGTTTFTKSSSTDKYTVSHNAATITKVAIGNQVGESTATINLAAGVTARTITDLEITGASTVNIASTGLANNTITTLKVGDNSNIVITGTKDLTITNAVAATTTGHKIDASGLSGKLAVTGSAQDDIIIGGSGADTITGSGGRDVITLGAGNDTVLYTAGTQSGITIATADTITDWGNGTNKINVAFVGATLIAQTTVQAAVNAAAPATFADALTAAAGQVVADRVGVFQYDGNTYVFVNDGAATVDAGDDLVIQLQGLHTLTADNFVL